MHHYANDFGGNPINRSTQINYRYPAVFERGNLVLFT